MSDALSIVFLPVILLAMSIINLRRNLEDTLDAVSRGEKEWIPVLDEFWKPFIQQIHDTDEQVQRKDVTTEVLDKACPKCGKPLAIRLGKRGRFIGCTGLSRMRLHAGS